MSSLFRYSLSPASPTLTVFSLIFLPSCLPCSIPYDFPPQQVVSSLAILTVLPALFNHFLSVPLEQCDPYFRGPINCFILFSCAGIWSVLVPVSGLSLSAQYGRHAFHHIYEVGPGHPGVRSVRVVPVWCWNLLFCLQGRWLWSCLQSGCLSSRLWCQFLPSHLQGRRLSSECKVSACRPGVKLLPVIPVWG